MITYIPSDLGSFYLYRWSEKDLTKEDIPELKYVYKDGTLGIPSEEYILGNDSRWNINRSYRPNNKSRLWVLHCFVPMSVDPKVHISADPYLYRETLG